MLSTAIYIGTAVVYVSALLGLSSIWTKIQVAFWSNDPMMVIVVAAIFLGTALSFTEDCINFVRKFGN